MPESEGKPSEPKGKGIDPRNWGALDVSKDELDVEAQCSALTSWNIACRLANESESDQLGPSNKRNLNIQAATPVPKGGAMQHHEKSYKEDALPGKTAQHVKNIQKECHKKNKSKERVMEQTSKAPLNPVKDLAHQ
ncbi:hypothetical protein PISMIDRAFT_15756 [Pisolithus microcarpus 441]|uniref:Unplaced genomic scaffold scaffold_170, whole genome shotgun sequence n=1 Tax=Pisolithus microcarpus 441 TaxID=765257 RepID=A0A0C9XVW6_9AGAM|nr:hypothetical protein PISMIDRAFT_15756 [Pisolithus microcarpus 441]